MKDLEEENASLKRIVANLTLEIDAVKYVLEKKYGGLTSCLCNPADFEDAFLESTRA